MPTGLHTQVKTMLQNANTLRFRQFYMVKGKQFTRKIHICSSNLRPEVFKSLNDEANMSFRAVLQPKIKHPNSHHEANPNEPGTENGKHHV